MECCDCKRPDLVEGDFTKSSKSPTGRQSKCKECHKKYQRKHYQENRELYNAKNKRCSAKKLSLIREAKNRPCLDCGESYPPYVMDFDHRDPSQKVDNISRLASNSASVRRLEEEIAKCDVVCANCHRERTYGKTPS